MSTALRSVDEMVRELSEAAELRQRALDATENAIGRFAITAEQAREIDEFLRHFKWPQRRTMRCVLPKQPGDSIWGRSFWLQRRRWRRGFGVVLATEDGSYPKWWPSLEIAQSIGVRQFLTDVARIANSSFEVRT